jgi:phosphoribosylamine--glycine ligase
MKVLVVGGGGREHALVRGLARSPKVRELIAAPGNAGIAREVRCEPVAIDDIEGVCALVEREGIDLTVVGPEGPLVAGLADELLSRGRRVFGPTRAGARLEGSKAWTKELCERYGIPAGRSRTVSDIDAALRELDGFDAPYVIKADGLAAGKGVVIAQTRDEAIAALRNALEEGAFGEAGSTVLIEEHLTGREVSAFALADGHRVLPLLFAQDFKRVGDGDTGPNTGGMGAISPVTWLDDVTAERIWDDVVHATIGAMAAEGVPYRGMLYAGLMLTDQGPKLLEYNCRFGDPETQAIVPRMRSDLAELLLAVAEGDLGGLTADVSSRSCVTVVAASEGYPGAYPTGREIHGLEAAAEVGDAIVFHSGTAERQGRVVTSGGRVLSVSGLGDSPAEARDRAYDALSRIAFDGMQFRRDIAAAVGEERG